MTRANYIRFPGNPSPAARRATSAQVITLPVIRIERYQIENEPPSRRKKKKPSGLVVTASPESAA